jgi:ABC-2 type transport system permease protein
MTTTATADTAAAPHTVAAIAPPRAGAVVLTLAMRRLTLMIRTPRSVAIPLLAPLLFALIVAPALGNTLGTAGSHTTYMTFVALSAAGLLIPVNCMFAGLGVLTDRQQGALRELLVAPIGRAAIVLGNLLAALAVTTMQVVVLILAAAARGANFRTGGHLLWFVAAALAFAVFVYGLAELFTTRISNAEEYTALVPPIAIVPFFFAGTLYPLTSLPGWLAGFAKVLPLTHAVALFRYGLTDQGAQALHNIWGGSHPVASAWASLAVVLGYAIAALTLAMRLFARAGTS